MKMHLLLTLAGLVIGFALPTFAQQKDAIDPELMKAVLHSCQVFDNAFNNNDPEALANLFTEDATLVTDSGVLHGRDDILKYQIGVFKVVHFGSHKNVPISAYPIGTDGSSSGPLDHGATLFRSKAESQQNKRDSGQRLSLTTGLASTSCRLGT